MWKRSNIIYVHEKNYYQLVENYRTISLLLIFWQNFLLPVGEEIKLAFDHLTLA